MATPKSLAALEKSKEAVLAIKERLVPVLQRLTEDSFGEETGRARASVALSIGMMRYMGARLRGLDQGRKPNDPLRKDLNNIKRILANTMKAQKASKSTTECSKKTAPGNPESKSVKTAPNNENDIMKVEKEVDKKEGDSKKTNTKNKKNKRKSGDVKSPGSAAKKAKKKR